mmetsp:Transcript_23167/g.33203  ORF Transcript_23167/g.33203 Transcript_23167/m.33203 type:complete len:159 (-) Transcript_23167:154-630(-)
MSKLSLGDDQILQMFIGMDISGNTAVHYSEFLGATLEYILNYEIPEVQVQEAFDRMDTTKTGFIDEDDLQQLFDMTREHAEKVMDAFGEQVVGYESFHRMLCPMGRERNNTVSKKRTGMMTKQQSEPSRSFTKISEEADRPQMDRLQSFQQPSPHHKD